MRRATLADVAQHARVDMSTASRVLRGDSEQRVSQETRARILASAEALEYVPNMLARGLKNARSYTIGITIPQLDNPVFYDAIQGAAAALKNRGYSLVINYVNPSEKDENLYKKLVQRRMVDGLLVSGFDTGEDLEKELNDLGFPHVTLNRDVPGARFSVSHDNQTAAMMAVDHLLELGHRRIVHLAGHQGGVNAMARLAGYKRALERAGVAYDESLVELAGYTAAGGATAMKRILERVSPRPTAIFAATLMSAAGALQVMHEKGIDIPGEMSMISLHDAPFASLVYPPLTTVALANEEMGRAAAELLLEVIEGSHNVPRRIVLSPVCLTRRASTAAAKA
ncbi:LacI family transcriptional regulator (plasmid) [Mesorhizobium sp. B2-1-8]|nr:LacI family DNA-binding transcriptional regulator [Mesorhizobium sp. B2-1-8]UCI22762.1 LacI family transcriptional regulator [Mesorhizobium sp. B2-1-8]